MEMAERGHTSSMTSVTEYDSSIDSESDTTESSNSNVTSSLLSSTDTDDKLTPSLGGISISTKSQSKVQTQMHEENDHTGIKRPQPYGRHGCIPSHKQSALTKGDNTLYNQPSKRIALHRKHRPHDRILPYALGHKHQSYISFNNNASCSSENLGVDDLDNKLSTDFSDTSSRAPAERLATINLSTPTSQEHERSNKEESDSNGELDGETVFTEPHSQPQAHPWEPDMSSRTWYQARCFSRYWNHYGFVMAWYQAHMNAVRTLHKELLTRHGGSNSNLGHPASSHFFNAQTGGSNIRHNRRAKRARNRRSAKQKRKAKNFVDKNSCDQNTPGNSTANWGNVVEGDEEEEVEMEITEDMMAFFKTSLKHRMERDIAKSEATAGKAEDERRVNIEDATSKKGLPSTAPPEERPGARRAQEMKELYGTGAPMIHGMETALQMTFDRTQDKFQPKLWPNMPLKIVFG